MSNNLLKKPRSMGNLLPPNYVSDEGRFDLNLPRIRPAWLMNEAVNSLDSKFPMVPAPNGTIVFYTTPLGEKLRQQPKNREFDLTDPLRPSLSYNCLHDEHLQVYFRSNDIRKRLLDDGFLTDDGYVKCSLKEFNEYRQWIRKLKLDELHRERRQDEKQIEDAKKERLERIALERDPELLEIMKRRREKRREEAKIHTTRIKREQDRQRKLEEIDRQRREKFVDMRRKTRDRIQIRRDLERERLRKKKCDDENKDHKIRIRFVNKLNRDLDERLQHIEERKNEAKEAKKMKLEEQWQRRESWSVEHHDHQKQLRELQEQEFHQHVEERNAKVARQRRCSQVYYDEIAETNRRAFETQLEKAEVFLAKLNDKKADELRKWRKKFDAMQKSSVCTFGTTSSHSLIKKLKKRARRQSAWDLESCLLKDLGLAEEEVKASSYSKLGVISRGNELSFMGDIMGTLGALMEEKDGEGRKGREFRFSIPTIVESLASIHEQSSDSESEHSFQIPSVFRFESLDDIPAITDSPETKPNDHIPESELRPLVKDYVQDILRRSADVLGVEIKLPDRTPRDQVPNIADVTRIPLTKEVDACDTNLRDKVKKYLSGILDKVEDRMNVSIKRPPEYEKIKEVSQAGTEEPAETAVDEIIDSRLHYQNQRTIIRQYLCKIVEDAADQSQITVKFPSQYQSFVKQLHRPRRKVPSAKDTSSQMAGEHTVVLRAISTGVLVLESVQQQKSMVISSPAVANELRQTASAIEEMRNKYDKVRAERLFHENLLMIATRTVVQAMQEAVSLVRTQRRNSRFFMSDLPNLYLEDNSRSSDKEQAVVFKKQRSRHRRESLKTNEIEPVPREVDFLKKISEIDSNGSGSEVTKEKKGGKHISFQAGTKPGDRNERIIAAKIDKFNKVYNTDNAGKKTASENKVPAKTAQGSGNKKANAEEITKSQGTGASTNVCEETGNDSEKKLDQETEASSQTIPPTVEVKISTSVENEAAATDEVDVTKEIGDKLADGGMETQVSTLSMKSPSLPEVTPQSSAFGLQDGVRSGAVTPNNDATSNAERHLAGSPSSAIFRMITMREQRESCDLSPQSSYVVLPTLTSSEGALINTRMAQLLGDGDKSSGLESTPDHFPALSPTPSKEAHAGSGPTAAHSSESVRLPSVPSVEICPPRSPTPVRSPSRGSQVALPHIDGSNTSLVGNNESSIQIGDGKPDPKSKEPQQATKSAQSVAVPPKTTAATKTAAKSPTPAKTPRQKIQPGKPPTRAKSEVSTRSNQIATPRKGVQAHSTTAVVTPKAITQSQQKNREDQKKKIDEQRKNTEEQNKNTKEQKKNSQEQNKNTEGQKKSTEEKNKNTKELNRNTKVQNKNTEEQNKNTGQQNKNTEEQNKNTEEQNKNTEEQNKNTEEQNKNTEVQNKNTEEQNKKSLDATPPTAEGQPQGRRMPKSKSTGDAIVTAARRNSQVGSQNKRKQSETTVRRGSVVEPDKNLAKSLNKKSRTSLEKTSQKADSGLLEKEEADTSQKSDAQNHPSKNASAVSKPSKTVTKLTQENHAKSTQDVDAKSTQNVKTTSSESSKSSESKPKMEVDSSKKADVTKSDKNALGITKSTQATKVEAVLHNADETKSKILPPVKDFKTTPSFQTQVVPKHLPETSLIPVETSFRSNVVDQVEKPKKPRVDVQTTSEENNDATSADSESQTILKNSDDNPDTSLENNADRTKTGSGKTKSGKNKKKKLDKAKDAYGNKPKDHNDGTAKIHEVGAKNTDSKAKVADDRVKDSNDGAKGPDDGENVPDDPAKISDDAAKISDIADQKKIDNDTPSKTAKDVKRKKSLKTDGNMKPGEVRSRSKTSSVLAMSKTSLQDGKVPRSRRSTRSVSFSSTLQQVEENRKQNEKEEIAEQEKRLVKRRSSSKAAKKASSKELKKRRSSLSTETGLKRKTKSTSRILAKVDSSTSGKMSSVNPSKTQLKTSKKSSKDAVAKKTKSESKSKALSDGQNRVDDTQVTRVDDTQETNVDDQHKAHVEEPQETRVDDLREIHVEDTQKTRVDDSQETREESEHALTKTESDVEVVVQVYVPDNQTEVSDQATVEASQENGDKAEPDKVEPDKVEPDKAEPTETGRQNEFKPRRPESILKIDLKPEVDDPGLKKTPSRRAFGDNVVEKNLVNIVPRNSMDIIKGIKLIPNEPKESKVTPNRSFHSRTNLPRAPAAPKPRGVHRTPMEGKPLKVSNFELPPAGQGLGALKPVVGNKAQISMHRLASKMSTNLEKVDEGSALVTGSPSSLSPERPGSEKLGTALSICKLAGVTAKEDKECSDDVEKKMENLKESSKKSLEFLMKSSAVCINSGSFADVVQGTPLLNKEAAGDDVTQQTSSPSMKSNSSQSFVPSPPMTAKPDMVSPRISRMMSRNMSNGSGKSRKSLGSNEMSPTASMEVVKLASNSSHGWVSSPTSSVKFLPPIDARASKASNRSEDSATKRRPRTTESAVSPTGSAGSGTSNGSRKAAVVEIRRSASAGLRIDGSSSGLVGVKSSTSGGGSPKQAVVGF